MALDPIVEQLQAERDRIDAALKALQTTQTTAGRRVMSQAARDKISKAMKNRWNKIKKPAQRATSQKPTNTPAQQAA